LFPCMRPHNASHANHNLIHTQKAFRFCLFLFGLFVSAHDDPLFSHKRLER
jgi:hypothetical protein